MTDEILLSESNLERVFMDADWKVRIEHTEAGKTRLALRKKATRNKRQTVVAFATSGIVAVSAVVWKVLG